MRILLLEDDHLIGSGIHMGLSGTGFSVDWFKDGPTGREAASMADYDAAILDLGLPGLDGLEILKGWRSQGKSLPVLILTARDAITQRVEGLNLGADDYLGKPFDLEELTARLRALVRRSHGISTPVLTHGQVTFHPDSRSVTRGGKPVSLGPREVMLVELLLLNGSGVLSKSTLEEKLYPWGEEVSSNSVEVLIHRIRRKLGNNFVKTVHAVGYTLGEPA